MLKLDLEDNLGLGNTFNFYRLKRSLFNRNLVFESNKLEKTLSKLLLTPTQWKCKKQIMTLL